MPPMLLVAWQQRNNSDSSRTKREHGGGITKDRSWHDAASRPVPNSEGSAHAEVHTDRLKRCVRSGAQLSEDNTSQQHTATPTQQIKPSNKKTANPLSSQDPTQGSEAGVSGTTTSAAWCCACARRAVPYCINPWSVQRAECSLILLQGNQGRNVKRSHVK